jgi:putative flippase GtrA
MSALIRQLLRFGVVGLGGLVVDIAVFNILRTTLLSPENVAAGPIIAKVISTSLAIVANWIGNRYWTFSTSRGQRVIREGFAFAIVSIGGMLIAVLCLWVSHYVLGFTSVLADNIASNVVGLGLGALLRFTLYRAWVFNEVGSRPSQQGVARLGRMPSNEIELEPR